MTARKYEPICSYPKCGRPHNAKGLCTAHGYLQRKGLPLRPIQNRTGPVERPAIDRFREKTEPSLDGCILWKGSTSKGGYGSFVANTAHGDGRREMAHRWIYEHTVGQIPDGYDIDHLCRTRNCVNPTHLEPVTRQENILRAATVKQHCVHGHPYTEENTLVPRGTNHRRCRTCIRERDLARAESKNAKRRAARAIQKGIASNGHIGND